MNDRPVLELRDVSKSFPGALALENVDFDVRAGEVHALLGENGAGKSTLIKIMAGVHTQDEGEYVVDGRAVPVTSPRDARDLGVSVVFQELSQVASLSVAENVFFGRLPSRGAGVVDQARLHREAREYLHAVGLTVDPATRLGFLSVAQRQLVEIARALSQDAKVIAMDEPTSALSHTEIETLFHLVEQLSARGVAVVYVSHKLDELFRVSDRITVLRDGRKVAERDTERTDADELIRLMVGRELDSLFPRTPASPAHPGAPLLEVEGLTSAMVRDVTFSVHAGEVVGFSGLMGAGRTELARALFGLDATTAGTVRVGGRTVPRHSSVQATRLGIGYVPEDRKADGLVLVSTVRANMTLAILRRLAHIGSRVNRSAERSIARDTVERLRIKAGSIEQQVAALSGGNQQKVMLARWLVKEDLKVLILDEPTRGIDVNSKSEIYRLVAAIAEQGVAVLVMSSELPELLSMCDRIHVMRDGRIVDGYRHDEATQEKLMSSALGGR
ncbi:sugar ABC transporter ATP-binding protein [Haloactinopolyspora sp.]|uniref:sugar ABC transporter ATP-binding protein n=1 Tax=Haloactinopolyspora sp. TaxID=1966353 RepID=UPI00261C5D6A|nr:sugar ABC transporter ATP-binding protein [Haloactinopolyspora sp.]